MKALVRRSVCSPLAEAHCPRETEGGELTKINPKINRNFENVDPVATLATLAQPLPDPGVQMR